MVLSESTFVCFLLAGLVLWTASHPRPCSA